VEECGPVQTYADAGALIDDPRVLACRIADNGEPLVDVRTVQSVACDMTRTDVQELSDNPFQLRASALDRLVRAQGFLPGRYQLQVKEAWRPIWVQERLWEASLGQLRDGRPDLTDQPGAGSRTAHPVADDARRHRDILAQAMDAAGFINYPQEWWHWSYGDRYWAFQTSAEATLYGPR
jgi:zinc D-Ala-D-Ala dipeptidase